MMTPPLEPSSPLDGGIRKRVCKACDRCRLKKSKVRLTVIGIVVNMLMLPSVTVPVHVVGARQITLYAYSASGRSLMTRSIRKGAHDSITCIISV